MTSRLTRALSRPQSRPAARPGITRNVSYASTITIVDESSPISSGGSSSEPWSFKEGSLPWDGEKIEGERGIPPPVPEEGNQRERRRWFRLGVWGFTTIALGSFVTLAILAFLAFLWTTEAVSGSERAPAAWRWVMLGGRATQAVTLATVVVRAAITAQSTVYTSLIAGIVLERHGVPLSMVAQFSVLRGVNDGPLRLAWLLLTSSPRRSALLAGLTVVLFATTVAVQFSSTILVSDLEFSALVGEARNATLPVFMTADVIELSHQSNGWLDRPTAYVPFGEISSPGAADAVPSETTGLSDTGVVRRVFLPVRQQQMIRRYHGPAIVFNSRFVCMRPSVVGARLTASNGTADRDGPPSVPRLDVSGGIDYAAAFAAAGLPLPPGCRRGSCFPQGFNCSLSQLRDQNARAREGFTNSICVPDGRGAAASARNFTLSDEAAPRHAGVFLFLRSNGTADLWQGPNMTAVSGQFPLAPQPRAAGGGGGGGGAAAAAADEWASYEVAVGGRFVGAQFTTGGLRVDASLCFQQVAFDMSEVKVWTPRDLRQPSVMWDSAKKRWDTTAVRRMVAPAERLSLPGGGGVGGAAGLGEVAAAAAAVVAEVAAPAVMAPEERGTFSVEWIGEPRRVDMVQYLTSRLINSNYNAPQAGGGNVSLLMDPLGVGEANFDFEPHVEYQVLFRDLLNATNRPGVALQSVLTALAGSMVSEVMPQFNVRANATVTSSEFVLTPRRARGLVVVAAVIVANMACGLAALALFALTTSYSARGSFWQVLSQLVSEHTSWVLECSTELEDRDVASLTTRDLDPYVKIARSGKTGRVQVILSSALKQGY
ncbi:hypothetical protein RB595_004337 [Gaeumannomyces hyphopodioides]